MPRPRRFDLSRGARWALLLSSLLLAACSSDRSLRPGVDGAPDGHFDVSTVPDAVPRTHTGPVKSTPYSLFGVKYYPLSTAVGYRQEGTASWYGTKFHGHKTANGETYNMYAMSAAHKTLPLPSYARVTNLANGRSVVVRVNDRGPFHGDRLIDMSYAAAHKLGFFGQGTARVRVEGIDPANFRAQAEENGAGPVSRGLSTEAPATTSSQGAAPLPAPERATEPRHPRMFLQVAALQNAQSAQSLQRRLSEVTRFPVAVVAGIEHPAPLHRVRIGPFATLQEVEEAKQQVDNAALGAPHLVYE
ncbi:septal ring lytic transglycosylase RlpA family protein [Aestuariirhabdus litorea]|uniref:Endolytic peptidoglycan transglycosylase RlpA n=1 Tax=Aestuariirhabdus litorea TaxID=2528527 RepID=A0A3P3VPK5_9GAMM|nr:septal ring lytic transglycosylase RlpA family protein [Aestuariirhabdus litorea]RRJ83569.1 septal ring lytic transglycosylase RlpA family protein [Aestuariirhabdus litorea]RWW96790.1 septal ring lytic transglycosylase RlpA family protein [Endozoicomonadaceae bacterium GTF-13]